MSNEHVHPIMQAALGQFATKDMSELIPNTEEFNPIAMAERYKAATKIADKGNHAMSQLYRSLTMLKIHYDHDALERNGYDPLDLWKNADALQEFIVSVSVFADQLDEDNRIRLAWERCVSKTVDVYDEAMEAQQ